jgi:hypothetical protein
MLNIVYPRFLSYMESHDAASIICQALDAEVAATDTTDVATGTDMEVEEVGELPPHPHFEEDLVLSSEEAGPQQTFLSSFSFEDDCP